MAVQSERVTVGTTPVRLDATDTNNAAGQRVIVRCSTAELYLGGPGVTSATGYALPAGDVFSADLDPGDQLFAVVAALPAQVAHVLRAGV